MSNTLKLILIFDCWKRTHVCKTKMNRSWNLLRSTLLPNAVFKRNWCQTGLIISTPARVKCSWGVSSLYYFFLHFISSSGLRICQFLCQFRAQTKYLVLIPDRRDKKYSWLRVAWGRYANDNYSLVMRNLWSLCGKKIGNVV